MNQVRVHYASTSVTFNVPDNELEVIRMGINRGDNSFAVVRPDGSKTILNLRNFTYITTQKVKGEK